MGFLYFNKYLYTMSLLHGLKVFIKKALPEPVVAAILKWKWERMKEIDLSVLSVIRAADRALLSDAKKLELELLPLLGINNELTYQLPQSLLPHTGKGLFYWQYPNQFSRYLVLLSQLHIDSYLEIGVRHGGTFILTIEYLKKFGALKKAIGVDIGYAPSVVAYSKEYPQVRFFQADSQTDRFKDMVHTAGDFDLVLIDGNHDEKECASDFETVHKVAGIIVLHDIASAVCPGVQKLWGVIKNNLDQYECYEFTEQYADVVERTGHHFFGIGVAVKKTYLRKKGLTPPAK